VLYVTNRCILCTRCVRFMDNVAAMPVLNVSERGDRATIGIHPEADLGGHAWSSNVIDLCPVGALVSKDFLNKARAWELDKTASVCPNCTQGCNSVIETREGTVVRMRPRPNDAVNQYYMCDYGRLEYRWLERRDRVELPYVRLAGAHGHAELTPSDWDVALEAAARLLQGRRTYVVASPRLPNEALHLLSRLVARTGGTGVYTVTQGAEAPLVGVEDLALRADRAANVAGAELFGFERRPMDDVLAGLGAGDVLVMADEELAGRQPALPAGVSLLVVGTVLPMWAAAADVVLPTANMAEEEGTFTNVRGRVQRYMQARPAPGLARPSWYAVGDLLAALGEGQGYWTAADAFQALATAHPRFTGLSYETLGFRGLPLVEQGAGQPELAGVGA
jgi:NADH-quinone oxidoreductase subunit G